LQATFRKYLRDKRVLAGNYDETIPESLTDEALNNYRMGLVNPDVSHPVLHWYSPFADEGWNSEMISLLVEEFGNKVDNGEYSSKGYDKMKLTHATLVRICRAKLAKMPKRVADRDRLRNSGASEVNIRTVIEEENEKRRQRARRRERRDTVSSLYTNLIVIFLQSK
jgi:hypothetical protein